MDVAQHLKQLTPAQLENLYNRLAGYRFAQRYVGAKSVVDVCWEEVGLGAHILAETARSVEGLTNSPGALESASTSYPAPNVSYREASLPELPYPADHLDVAVVFEVIEKLERPEDLMGEIKRVLKQDGLLVISTPDKQTHSTERGHRGPEHRREVYVPEFQELLERHFEHVHVYRQGTVAGSLIFRASEKVDGASVESARSTSTNPLFGPKPPTTRFVVAVCSDVEVPEQEGEGPYLLLDRDRRVFDEHEDRCEDVELLRDEIGQMQETEVQAFQEAYHFRNSEISHLRAQLDRSEAEVKNSEAQAQRLMALMAQNERLRDQIHGMENSVTWRLFGPYRRLRARIDGLRNAPPGGTEGSDDRRAD
jgi:SAM-dependent methyltransferase